jgi:hypothetical protein
MTTRNHQKKTTRAFHPLMAPAWLDDLLQTLQLETHLHRHGDPRRLLLLPLTSRQLVVAPEHLQYASAAKTSKFLLFTSTPQLQKRTSTKPHDKHSSVFETTVV